MKKIVLLSVVLLTGCVIRTDASINTNSICTDNTPAYQRTSDQVAYTHLSKGTMVTRLWSESTKERVRIPSGKRLFIDSKDIC